MTYNPYPRLPIGPLRDLCGITRALYRAARAEVPPDASRLAALESIGSALRGALQQASGHPGTIPYQDAWEATEHAIAALQGLVGEAMVVRALIDVTACLSRARQTVGASGVTV